MMDQVNEMRDSVQTLTDGASQQLELELASQEAFEILSEKVLNTRS